MKDMSLEAFMFLYDCHQHGFVGFAAEVGWKARVLKFIHYLGAILMQAFSKGGGGSNKEPSTFELMPEARRYFDPAYMTTEEFKGQFDEDGKQIASAGMRSALEKMYQKAMEDQKQADQQSEAKNALQNNPKT